MARQLSRPLPPRVLAVVAAFLQRYYLHHSVLDHDPELVALTCMLLACKAEEFNGLRLDHLANEHPDPDAARDFIKQHELEVLQELKFQLVVFSAFRPLRGLVLALGAMATPPANLPALHQQAENLLRSWLPSDVGLCFPPSQIALAALHQCAASNGIDLLNVRNQH